MAGKLRPGTWRLRCRPGLLRPAAALPAPRCPLPGLRPHARSVGQRPAALPAHVGPVERPPTGSASQLTARWSVRAPCRWGLQSLPWPRRAAGTPLAPTGEGSTVWRRRQNTSGCQPGPVVLGAPAAGLGQRWPARAAGGGIEDPCSPGTCSGTPTVCPVAGSPVLVSWPPRGLLLITGQGWGGEGGSSASRLPPSRPPRWDK